MAVGFERRSISARAADLPAASEKPPCQPTLLRREPGGPQRLTVAEQPLVREHVVGRSRDVRNPPVPELDQVADRAGGRTDIVDPHRRQPRSVDPLADHDDRIAGLGRPCLRRSH